MKINLFFATIITLTATVWSLYFSEVVGFIPCKLCWMQRILMYPLFLIFLYQIIYNHLKIFPGVLFSTLGIFLSAYHYGLQNSFFGSQESSCSLVSCGVKYVNYYGFITIPFLSLVAFTLTTMLLILGAINQKKRGLFK